MVVYLINPKKLGWVFLGWALVWEETGFEDHYCFSHREESDVLWDSPVLGVLPGWLCPAEPHKRPCPPHLCSHSVERVAKHKAKIYWQRHQAKACSHRADGGGGDWSQGHPTMRPHFWHLCTQALIYSRLGSSSQTEYICPLLAQMCLMHNGKLKERLQFKTQGQWGKKSECAHPRPPTPNPKPRVSSWVQETVGELGVVIVEGILPACRQVGNTVGVNEVKS